MNKTQKIIILVGDMTLCRKALDVISGFKAVTIVKDLKSETIESVFKHNKNVVFAKSVYDIDLAEHEPIVINLTKQKTNIISMQLSLDNIIDDFPKILDTKHIDVGDHICHDSKNIRADNKDCLLCKIVHGNPERPEHILYESYNFFVVPGLGAFFDGYVMIVPKRHVMSFAELNSSEYDEFLEVLRDMKFILESIYKKKLFIFECGSGKNGGGKHKTSIVHAHMHLAPTDMPVLKNVQKSGLHPALIEAKDLRNYGNYPYMLYVDQQDNWYIISDPDTYFPRQHPRQVLADYMQLPKNAYNWRINPLPERMDIIADEIYSFLRKNYSLLPNWIQIAVKKHIN